MDPTQERQLNHAAYRQLKHLIQQAYPPGRFVGISGGKIIADAARFEVLNSIPHQLGLHSAEVLVAQEGVEYRGDGDDFSPGGYEIHWDEDRDRLEGARERLTPHYQYLPIFTIRDLGIGCWARSQAICSLDQDKAVMTPSQLCPGWIVFAALCLFVGCNKSEAPPKLPSAGEAHVAQVNRPSDATLPPQEWAKKSPKNWPQIVLTNYAQFKGHSGLRGASAFLVESPNGSILAATAGHLIGEAGGVEPPIQVTKLDTVLLWWKVHPRTEPEKSVEVGRVAFSGPEDENNDWLVLSLKEPSAAVLPATPLKLRSVPVQIGETVWLIGCPYVGSDCKQNVYQGRVTKRALGDRFQYTLSPPVDLRGFSGAPIIDSQGYAVGVMTIWFDRVLQVEMDTLGGGEDAATLVRLLNNR